MNQNDTTSLDRRQLFRHATALLGATAAGVDTISAQEASADARLFPGFQVSTVQTSGASIHVVSGGQGPPLLLMHGAPQSHATWYKIAPDLAKEYTLVMIDLR